VRPAMTGGFPDRIYLPAVWMKAEEDNLIALLVEAIDADVPAEIEGLGLIA